MENHRPSADKICLPALTRQMRHDLKSALLSVRWAAEMLSAGDGSEFPHALLSQQLMQSYQLLLPFIDTIASEPPETAHSDGTESC